MADTRYHQVVALLPFNSADSTDDVSDSNLSANASGGASTSATRFRHGDRSLFLDGVDDYVTVTGNTDEIEWIAKGFESYTFECWINIVGAAGVEYMICDMGGGADSTGGFPEGGPALMVDASRKLKATFSNGSGTFMGTMVSATTMSANTWHHVALEFDSATKLATIYIDGVVEDTVDLSGETFPDFQQGGGWALGYATYDFDRYFSGYIDDARFTRGAVRYGGPFSTPGEHSRVYDDGVDPDWNDVTFLPKFHGADGDTTADDLSLDGRLLTFVGGAQLDDAQFLDGATSLLLDGVDDYVSFPTSGLLDLNGTWAIQIKVLRGPSSSAGVLFSTVTGSGVSKNGIEIVHTGFDEIQAFIYNAGVSVVNAFIGYINDFDFTEITLQNNNGNFYSFINGGEGNGAEQGVTLPTIGGATAYIGCRNETGTPSDFFNGWIDSIRITNAWRYQPGLFSYPYSIVEYPVPSVGNPTLIDLPLPIDPAFRVLVAVPFDATFTLPLPLDQPQALAFLSDPSNSRVELPLTFLTTSAVVALTPSVRVDLPLPIDPVPIVFVDFLDLITDPTERYEFELLTDPVQVIPISSWQATVQRDRESFLQVVVPAITQYISAINAAVQAGAEMRVVRSTNIQGNRVTVEMARATIRSAITSGGSLRETTVLRGYTASFESPVRPTNTRLRQIRTRSLSGNGDIRIRCAIDWNLRPGQEVNDGDSLNFFVDYINYFVPTIGDAYMDVGSRSG